MGEVGKGEQSKGDDDIEGAQENDGEVDEPGKGPPRQAGGEDGDTTGHGEDGSGIHGGEGVYVCVVCQGARCINLCMSFISIFLRAFHWLAGAERRRAIGD